jgi:hypothetical protein
VIKMAGMLRVRRSQGALSGGCLVLLGLWGALIPFVGPYFHFAYTPTPDRAWAVTAGRMWLEVAPGAVTLLSGAVMIISRFRLLVLLGAWLAALAGTWFAVGSLVAARWATLPAAGKPAGTGIARLLAEQLGFFTGLGVVIIFVAAAALGRLTVLGAREEEEEAWDDYAEPKSEPRVLESAGAGRGLARIVPVPVFRGRQRDAARN